MVVPYFDLNFHFILYMVRCGCLIESNAKRIARGPDTLHAYADTSEMAISDDNSVHDGHSTFVIVRLHQLSHVRKILDALNGLAATH